jgi:hypothetical protein
VDNPPSTNKQKKDSFKKPQAGKAPPPPLYDPTPIPKAKSNKADFDFEFL